MSEPLEKVDIREIEPHANKYPTVHKTFENLNSGEKIELISDHDLRPLFEYKFPVDFPDQYEWSYAEKGPEVWRVIVTRTNK